MLQFMPPAVMIFPLHGGPTSWDAYFVEGSLGDHSAVVSWQGALDGAALWDM